MFIFGLIVGGALVGPAVWFGKERAIELVHGTAATVTKLRAKAEAMERAVRGGG